MLHKTTDRLSENTKVTKEKDLGAGGWGLIPAIPEPGNLRQEVS